ncbi:MAG TPA: RNA methyltransferase [Ktedonobacterales bacterium]|nr:RNA methyltransferase [Ktedonobacterales bacterium]
MTQGARQWEARVRHLASRRVREEEGVCYVEGIRPVLDALESGVPLEVLLISPEMLRSEVALQKVREQAALGTLVMELSRASFERFSDRDNPVGLAAIVRWTPLDLASLPAGPDTLMVMAEDMRDPGNLGTLLRTMDAIGGTGVVVVGSSTDPTHPRCLKASMGTIFRIPVARAASVEAFLHWAKERKLRTVATTARRGSSFWSLEYRRPLALLLGNEGEGLSQETIGMADAVARIPMWGTASSLNVSVAAGVLLYEVRRQETGRPQH